MGFDKCFRFGVLNQDAQLFKDPVVIVHGYSFMLSLDVTSSNVVFQIEGVVQYLLLPDLHDSPLYSPRTCQHFNFVDFIALNVLIRVRIERGQKSWENWVVIGVSDACFRIRLSHCANKGMLPDQDTFDQLVVTHA